MLLFQDGSTHRWLVDLGRDLDLIATMDDATGELISAFLVEEEGTKGNFQGPALGVGADFGLHGDDGGGAARPCRDVHAPRGRS